MLNGPVFTEPLSSGTVGDDPLGLAPVNERLYNDVFPGINNYVRYIRVYSSLCWMAYRVEQHLETVGSKISKAQASVIAKCAYEKIQLVLIWVNQAKNYTQVAGNSRFFPEDNRKVELTFDQFKDSSANLLAAVAYGPSLTNGLGFLERKAHGILHCTDAGRQLAEAFNKHALAFENYKWLADVTNLTGTKDKVFGFVDLFDLGKATSAEQHAFLWQFFPNDPSHLDQWGRNRWRSIHLVLRAMCAIHDPVEDSQSKAYTREQAIRACMTTARAPGGKPFDVRGVEDMQVLWAILQLRQLHRLALDTLFTATEAWLSQERTLDSDNSIEAVALVISKSAEPLLEKQVSQQVSQILENFKEIQGKYPSLAATSSFEPETTDADLFAWVNRLWEGDNAFDEDNGNEAVYFAYVTLMFCAVEASNLMVEPASKKALLAVDNGACSLVALVQAVQQFNTVTPSDFLRHIVKNWVVLRHFRIVDERSQVNDGKNRFRFVVGDNGLERFDPANGISRPAFASDKLAHIIHLCVQGGLMTEQQGLFKLTKTGRARIDDLKA